MPGSEACRDCRTAVLVHRAARRRRHASRMKYWEDGVGVYCMVPVRAGHRQCLHSLRRENTSTVPVRPGLPASRPAGRYSDDGATNANAHDALADCTACPNNSRTGIATGSDIWRIAWLMQVTLAVVEIFLRALPAGRPGLLCSCVHDLWRGKYNVNGASTTETACIASCRQEQR